MCYLFKEKKEVEELKFKPCEPIVFATGEVL